MIYNFEFTETPGSYRLLLNNAVVRVWGKTRHSKQEAEERASNIVSRSIGLYGMSKVTYNGNHSLVTMADNFFNKIKS